MDLGSLILSDRLAPLFLSLQISRVNPRTALTYSSKAPVPTFQLVRTELIVGDPRAAAYSRSAVPTGHQVQASPGLAGKGDEFIFSGSVITMAFNRILRLSGLLMLPLCGKGLEISSKGLSCSLAFTAVNHDWSPLNQRVPVDKGPLQDPVHQSQLP